MNYFIYEVSVMLVTIALIFPFLAIIRGSILVIINLVKTVLFAIVCRDTLKEQWRDYKPEPKKAFVFKGITFGGDE